ncbi:hypothetical protein VSS37_08835 [Candidatus Thiothrix sp. Deng01]|uniref:Uncharacterized protein n=1 Tax=Candidatus Thiothrix phosphatis TaxID=3112415 RepID=A0ABU6CWC2_9GAMM|nr:hypothetical protein [Candidatus Thiothrix sp. Deng01]MEB4591080.1 hypothetical protein [Candidatus Thiothrix sp. Deng01]
MFNKNYLLLVAVLLAGLLATQPTLAMSQMGKQRQIQRGNSPTTDNAGDYFVLEASTLRRLLPELLETTLYTHLLQSDLFITLSGMTEYVLDKHSTKAR